MSRILRLLLGSATGLLMTILTLRCAGIDSHLPFESRSILRQQQIYQKDQQGFSPSGTSLPNIQPYPFPIFDGALLPAERIGPHVKAIFDHSAVDPPRLKCPTLRSERYAVLRKQNSPERANKVPANIDFYFALNLQNCLPLLPRLLSSIVEAVQFLGVERCAVSIVEGNSPDGTGDVLRALRPFFEDIGLRYWYQESSIDPSAGQRIPRSAELRNLALDPLVRNQHHISEHTTVLFISEVAACTEDLLELALQRRRLNADMTCAMDWTGNNPSMSYNSWDGRTIEGDSFFEIHPNGSWKQTEDLFPNSPITRARFLAKKPFQVFACWNGASAIRAAPILQGLRFRAPYDHECSQGEPQLFCKDLWFHGHRKIAVVPTINLAHTNENAALVKQLKGYTSGWTDEEYKEETPIDWVLEPPEQVKCMPTWSTQYWAAWNETL